MERFRGCEISCSACFSDSSERYILYKLGLGLIAIVVVWIGVRSD